MAIGSQYGQTLYLENFQSIQAQPLQPVSLLKGAGAEYDEGWLQQLVMRHPELLPIDEIDKGLGDLVPAALELAVPTGYIDNLFVTPSGNLVLVECKLFRNPESRRKVVAQIIDYATELSKWDYQRLDDAVIRTGVPNGTKPGERKGLYDRVANGREVDEARFHDAVSRNLRLGRFLLVVAGDGIQEGVLGMSEFLQQHAGLHFTLAVVELALFRLPSGGYIAQPRLFAKTVNIERGIVRFEDDRLRIGAVSSDLSVAAQPPRQTSISKEQFLEDLERRCPDAVPALNKFLDSLPGYGVEAEFGKSVNLRWYGGEDKGWNLGQMASGGELWLDGIYHRAKNRDLLSDAKEYIASLAALAPGSRIRQTPSGFEQILGADGKNVKYTELLAEGNRIEGWLQAIARFQQAVAQTQ